MKMCFRSISQIFLLFIILFSFPSCKQEARIAEPMSESVQAYIYGYTQGVISRGDHLKVQFATAVATEEQIGLEDEKKIISLSPQPAGKWSWLDRQTLIFETEGLLDAGTTFLASVDLTKVFDNLAEDAKRFEFNFQTRAPNITLKTAGFSTPDLNAPEKQVLSGQMVSSDIIETEKKENLLEASQDGRTLPVTWTEVENEIVHHFVVKDVIRGEDAGTVTLLWNGNPIGFEEKGEEKIEVPSVSEFKVSSVSFEMKPEPHVRIHFSDPLKLDQNFEGLITIDNSNNDFRYLLDGHYLKVYTSEAMSGTHKITVHAGVKNYWERPIDRVSQWEIGFTTAKPQVRLVGSGVILPTTNGLVFPFEAIGLNAVEVEIFKIYHSNILQFLQVNNFDGQRDLTRVGKVLLRQEVKLNGLNGAANQGQWEKYAINLEDLIDADPNAIYQVRIGFRRQHSLYPCDKDLTFEFNDNYREPESIMQAWQGLEGYYNGHRWNHREDPCYPAYYGSNNFVQRNILASNLGIIAKANDKNEYFIAVTDLRSATALGGVELSFYDFQQQLIGTAITDTEGKAQTTFDESPFAIIAKNNTEQGYLKLQDGESLSLSQFDVSGVAPQEGMKGFLYGERGVWRPGDSIFLNFVLEDEGKQLPKNYPITFELRDPQGQLREQRTGVLPEGRIYPLFCKTDRDDLTGTWRAKVKVGNANFYHSVRIETVKPNRLKVDLDFGNETLVGTAGEVEGAIQSTWLHGAPASNLKANIEANFSTRYNPFETYKNFDWHDPENKTQAVSAVIFDKTLDEDGNGDITLKLPNGTNASGPLKVRMRSRVFERGGDFSTGIQDFNYHPYNNYVGVKVPQNKYGYARILRGKDETIQFVSLNADGQPQSNRNLKVEIFEVEWRWWWDSNRSRRNYNSRRVLTALKEGEVTTDRNGKASWNVKVESWGRYLIRACDTESGHCSGSYVYAGYPSYYNTENKQDAAMLMFKSDKTDYLTGEEVTLTFPAGANGRALISLETGKEILATHWVDVKAGDNDWTFTATKEMAPTVYAHIMVMQPHSQTDNDLPIRLYGVLPIKVEDEQTRLHPEVKVADELKPEETFAVAVEEKNGQPLTYTLAVVDEGLLGLTRFKTPNPHDAFFAKEALGIKTWDMYEYVLGARGDEMSSLLSIGGDGELDGSAKKENANRFDPVVMHLGPFELKAGEKASHQLTMPNYIGAVRVMVVAVGDGAYGSTDKSVPVRKPLMALATVPRVLGVQESFNLPVNIFAMKDHVKNVRVRVEESSGLVQVVTTERSLRFQRLGDQLADFTIKVGDQPGIAKFKIIAEGNGETATQEIEVDIRNPNPMQTVFEQYVIDAGAEQSLPLALFGSAGTRTNILEVTNLPPLNLERRLSYLLRYPYGCLEQTMSGGFPQLYLARFIELSPEQSTAIKRNIEATLNRLRRFQLASGGFTYWPGNTEVDAWSTCYVGHFLLKAKEEGYVLPAGMLENWLRFQKQAARKWAPELADYGYVRRSSYHLTQAYRLFTLSLAGAAEMGAMNQFRNVKDLSKASKWRLAAAYALNGQVPIAKELTNNIDYEIETYREMSYTYGSSFRDRAMILETLLLMDNKNTADKLALDLAEYMGGRRWMSTQETAYGLLALSHYIGASDNLDKTFTFSYAQNGARMTDAGSDHPYMQIQLADKAGNVMVKNTSSQKLFVALIRHGQPLPEEEEAFASQIRLDVLYKDKAGKILDVTQLEQGTDFVAEVKVSHLGGYDYRFEEMALRQIFPSGWEITNTRFEGLPTEEAGFDYRDYRDDRVHTFFDLYRGNPRVYRVFLTAAYQGRFYLPATTCEAMYDDKIYANSTGEWVEVGKRADF